MPVPQFEVAANRFGARAVVTVWIDLTALTFIDSSGLNVLCSANNRFAGALTVICPPHVRRVFEIAGLAGAEIFLFEPAG